MNILSRLYNYCAWSYFVVFYFLVPLFAVPFSWLLGKKRAFRASFRIFVAFGLLILGLRPKVKGKENIPKGKQVILISNHPSFLDPFMINTVCGRFINHIIYASILNNPVCKVTIKGCGLVVRSSGAELGGSAALIDLYKRLDEGDSFILFPSEKAIRGKEKPKIKRAFYEIVKRTNAVVIPVYISDGIVMADPKRPVRQTVIIGKPLTKQELVLGQDHFIYNSIYSLSGI
jgi:1-acyl-sn-glycerol-3-phosphate acyltransferase